MTRRWPCIAVTMLCSILAIVAATSAEDLQAFPTELLDPKFLAAQTWRQDSELEKTVAGWPPYSGKQDFDDKKVLRQSRVGILGGAFQTEYRVLAADLTVEIIAYSGAGDYTRTCSDLLDWLSRQFGTPKTIVDVSISGKQNSSVDLSADWLFGQTRVQVSCGGVKMHDEFIPAVLFVLYRHQAWLKALQSLIYIECSVTRRAWADHLDKGTTQSAAPVVFIIDPNQERLLRLDKSPLGKTERYSEGEIVVSIGDLKNSTIINLNRVTGSYLMQLRPKQNQSAGLDQWGKCERVSPGKKF